MSAVPVTVGSRLVIFLGFLRSTKPEDTSFSMIPERVAGVPMPLRSASSGISSLLAFSIAASSVSSVKCLGGVVFPVLTDAADTESVCCSVTTGSAGAASACSCS